MPFNVGNFALKVWVMQLLEGQEETSVSWKWKCRDSDSPSNETWGGGDNSKH